VGDRGAGSAHFGAPRVVGHGGTYKVDKAARGRQIACVASAENDGGYIQIGLVNGTVRHDRRGRAVVAARHGALQRHQ
jgi:hypothetical protein